MKKKQTKIILIGVALIIVVTIAVTIYLFVMKKDNKTGAGDNFTCPTEKFINCMPQVGSTAKEKAAAERQNRYCDFVAKNCPGVIIAE